MTVFACKIAALCDYTGIIAADDSKVLIRPQIGELVQVANPCLIVCTHVVSRQGVLCHRRRFLSLPPLHDTAAAQNYRQRERGGQLLQVVVKFSLPSRKFCGKLF